MIVCGVSMLLLSVVYMFVVTCLCTLSMYVGNNSLAIVPYEFNSIVVK